MSAPAYMAPEQGAPTCPGCRAPITAERLGQWRRAVRERHLNSGTPPVWCATCARRRKQMGSKQRREMDRRVGRRP